MPHYIIVNGKIDFTRITEFVKMLFADRRITDTFTPWPKGPIDQKEDRKDA